MKKRKDRQSC